MTSIRTRLLVCVIAVLVCQTASLFAAPVALCRGALSLAGELDECCRNLGPGETCPMHRNAHDGGDGRGLVWACVCSPSVAALASLIGVSGVLSAPAGATCTTVRADAAVPEPPSILERTLPPTSPPPRS